jgi:hypothetical protein
MLSKLKRNLDPNNLRKASSILALVGCPGFVFCFMLHICMAGHMRHPPYPVWHYISDFVWLISYLLAGILAISSNITCRKSYSFVLLFLCLSRLLGSGGGGFIIFELPALIFVIINSIQGFRRAGFDKKQVSEIVLEQHKKNIKRGWLIAGICIAMCFIIAWISWIIFDIIRVGRVPSIVVSDNSLPFTQTFRLNEGDAIWIELPNRKKVAFWDYFFHPDWGERPYKSPKRIWKKISSAQKTSDRVKSYMQIGLDTARSTNDEKEFAWFVDNYCIASECEEVEDDVYDFSITVRYAKEDEIAHLKNKYGMWPLFK